MRFVKPLDEHMLEDLLKQHQGFVTIEDHSVIGGAGSAVAQFLALQNSSVKLLSLGHEDTALAHGTRAQVLHATGLSEPLMKEKIELWQASLLAD
jgi:1-deoxy-D-xylulose-5-phosphate synthase